LAAGIEDGGGGGAESKWSEASIGLGRRNGGGRPPARLQSNATEISLRCFIVHGGHSRTSFLLLRLLPATCTCTSASTPPSHPRLRAVPRNRHEPLLPFKVLLCSVLSIGATRRRISGAVRGVPRKGLLEPGDTEARAGAGERWAAHRSPLTAGVCVSGERLGEASR
jgi:hypothetical protein